MKFKLLSLSLVTFLTVFEGMAEAEAAMGACVYQRPAPRVRCSRTSSQTCRQIGGTFYAGKTCAQVRQENNSSAQVSVANLGAVIATAQREGRAIGTAEFFATDVFSERSTAAGTAATFKGKATFQLTKVSPRMFKIQSLDTALEPVSVKVRKLPFHIIERARELFSTIFFTNFAFTGTLRIQGPFAYVTLDQTKSFMVEAAMTEDGGNVESQSSARFRLGQSQFHLQTKGLTYHRDLVDFSAPIIDIE